MLFLLRACMGVSRRGETAIWSTPGNWE